MGRQRWHGSDAPSDPYRCPVCGKDYPVRCMASDCRRKHEREDAERDR